MLHIVASNNEEARLVVAVAHSLPRKVVGPWIGLQAQHILPSITDDVTRTGEAHELGGRRYGLRHCPVNEIVALALCHEAVDAVWCSLGDRIEKEKSAMVVGYSRVAIGNGIITTQQDGGLER